ncbi:MAG: iron-containing alcohol dehydrogenase [Christensenellales bacterium]
MNVFQKAFCRIYQAGMRVGMKVMNFREPTIIDGLDKLPSSVVKEGLSSVLIVTDDVLHNKLHLIDGLKAGLEEKNVKYCVYDKTVPNPTISNIEEAYAMYKENACEGIIAFGGGSPMDCAKGVGCRVARPGKTIPQMKGTLKVMKKLPVIFAIPTTSGTGSEATVAAVVSNPETHEKYPINDPVLIPKYAVLDPTLTLGLPKHITSTTGMDALTHAVEAYIGKSNTPKTRDWSVKATKLIFENLKAVYDDGSDVKKRKNMQWASFFAGEAFTRAYVGYVHSIAHTLGGQYGVPHGLANAVILPHVLDYYGASVYQPLSELANAVGIKGASTEAKAKAFIQAIKDMNAYMDIPTQIKGIKEEDIPQMVERSYKEANPLYPVPKFMGKEEMAAMYREISAPAE